MTNKNKVVNVHRDDQCHKTHRKKKKKKILTLEVDLILVGNLSAVVAQSCARQLRGSKFAPNGHLELLRRDVAVATCLERELSLNILGRCKVTIGDRA